LPTIIYHMELSVELMLAATGFVTTRHMCLVKYIIQMFLHPCSS
jgi:hypothetical protein